MEDWSRRAHATAVLMCAALLWGCATAQPSGYPTGFDRMPPGQHVERFWYDASAIAAQPIGDVVLARLDVSRAIADQDGVTREQAAEWLRSALISGMSDTVLVVSPSGAPARVELAITELTTGSAITRVLVGELGAGHAFVQVEGRVFGPSGDRPIAEFADRRRHSGAAGVRDTFGDAGPELVREMLTEIGRDLLREMRAAFAPANVQGRCEERLEGAAPSAPVGSADAPSVQQAPTERRPPS